MNLRPHLLILVLSLLSPCAATFAAAVPTPEEVWRSVEKLSPDERNKKLIEGAKKEGEMLWYTNSGIENATRYIQAFRKNFPFINAQVWRAKTRQVTQRVISEANAGRHLVDLWRQRLEPAGGDRLAAGDRPLQALRPAAAAAAAPSTGRRRR